MQLDEISKGLLATTDFNELIDELRELLGFAVDYQLYQAISPLLGLAPRYFFYCRRGTRIPSRRLIQSLRLLELLLRLDSSAAAELRAVS